MPIKLIKAYDAKYNELKGQFATDNDYDSIIQWDTDIYDEESGDLIISFRKGVIKTETIRKAFKVLEPLSNNGTTLRYNISGIPYQFEGQGRERHIVKFEAPFVKSNIIGFFSDGMVHNVLKKRYPNVKKDFTSNMTAYLIKNYYDFVSDVCPMLYELNAQYKALAPLKHAEQMYEADKTEFRIEGTPWTTMTVNRDTQCAYHTDSNNTKQGLGNLMVYEGSYYKGGYLVFPNYRVAVDCRMGDVLIMNQHILHGNTPIVKEDNSKPIGRVSFVAYTHRTVISDAEKRNPSFADYCRYLYELDEAKKAIKNDVYVAGK